MRRLTRPNLSIKEGLRVLGVSVLLCFASLAALILPTTLFAQSSKRTPRILVLYWDNKDFPGNIRFDESFKAALQNELGSDFEYYPEYLETTRFPGQDQGFFREYLRQKYTGRSFDLLVANADPPLNFLLTHRAELFPNTPIVFVANDPPGADRLATGPGMTGLVHQSNHRQTLELALKLHPQTKRVFVISGSVEKDKRFEVVARRELKSFESRIEIEYLTDLPLNELISRTASLPRDSIALYIWQQANDEQGRLLETFEVIGRIAPSSSVPMYGLGSGNLGQGIVGGYLVGPQNNGKKVGEISLRILKGMPARDIPVEGAPAVAMFDWRVLKRWEISESSLPAGSTVSFREFSVWDRYKWYILALFAAILIEAALIAWLLFTRSKRRQAEQETKRSKALVEQAHQRLQETVSNVPGIVWEASYNPKTKERKTTFISDYVETMLGYTPDEWLAQKPGFGMEIMVEEDREAAASATNEALSTGKDAVSQHRWRAKDGRIIWVETHMSAVLNRDGQPDGLRGVSLDITERRLAEETVQKTQETNRAILEAIPDLIFLQTPDGIYVDLHYSDPTRLLVPPNEYLGKSMYEILPTELAARFGYCFQRALATGEPQLVEYQLDIRGAERWYESRVVACGEKLLSVVRDITERREGERALSESEGRLRRAQEAARVGTWEWHLPTGKSIWSDMIWELLGVTRNGPVSVDSFVEFIHPEDRERAMTKVNEVIAGGDDYYDEFRIVRRDGRVLWLSSQGRVLRSADGVPERMIGVNVDISRRKLAEDTVRETQQKDTAILNAIPDLMFLQTRDGVYLDYHAKNVKDLLFAPQDFIGKNMSEVLPPELATKFAECFARAEESREPQIVEYQLQMNGTPHWYEARLVRSGDNVLTLVRDITERKQALDELRESEERFATAFRANPQPMTLTALADGRFVDVNDAFLLVSGYSREEVIGHTAPELGIWATPTDRADFIQMLNEGGSVVNVERSVRAKDGSLRLLLMSAERVVVAGEECVLVASTDITERKRAEEALHESEEKYRTLFESIDEGFCVFNLIYDEGGRAVDFVFRVTNPAFERQTGWKDVVGMRVRELAPDLEEYWFEKYAQVAATNLPVRFMDWAAALNRWYEVYAFPVGDAGGRTVAVIFSDVSERVRAQQTLQESEARFRNMADTAPVLIWVCDPDKRCTYVNQQWIEFTGRTMEQELDSGWIEGIHPGDGNRCHEIFTTAVDRREPFNLEYRLRSADGSFRWVFDRGTPRFSSANEFLGYIGSCVDITDRKKSEEALVKAHEELVTAHEEVSRMKSQLEVENIYLQEALQLDQKVGDMVGESHALKYVMFKITQVAETDSTVLITGETGTGKELVASAIHNVSRRKSRPLIKVNCAALPANLIESELFGYEKGAFSGATARKLGRFELANGGSIFLDEIGDLPLESQVKLLRTIQDGELERLGGTKTIKVDVRIIAATNRDLVSEVEKGNFRGDLWYRLNVFPITVPPLRQRKEDVPLLVEYFVSQYARKFGKTITSISPATLESLQAYSWPGNVRELANVIERAVIYTRGKVLHVVDVFESGAQQTSADVKKLEQVEREYILNILEHAGWRIEGPRGAARLLGLNPSTLRTRMIKLGIHKQNATANGKNGAA